MPKRIVNVSSSGRLTELDLVSYGRRGPQRPLEFSIAQLDQIRRTVTRTPEVMVKVSGGGKSPEAVAAHFAYIDRHGKLEVHTDEDEKLQGKLVAEIMVDDWNLAASKGQYRSAGTTGSNDARLKLVHNIVFSMPAGTSPKKMLAATKKFARDKFAFEHRYAMVLHTDQSHAHVHLVVKAQSEQGQRLHIRKATLRTWREDFAADLRELGVAANATPIAVRGLPKTRKPEGMYRAIERGESTFLRQKVERIADRIRRGMEDVSEPTLARLTATRNRVVQDWSETITHLRVQGAAQVVRAVTEFLRTMPAATTEDQLLAEGLRRQLADKGRASKSRHTEDQVQRLHR